MSEQERLRLLKEAYDRTFDRKAEETHRAPRTNFLKCPRCGAMAFNLWQIYGVSYFKCEACGYKTQNL